MLGEIQGDYFVIRAHGGRLGLPLASNGLLNTDVMLHGLVSDEMCEGFSLCYLINQEQGPLQHRQAVDYATQVARAVLYLHSQQPPIIHR